MSCQIWSDNVTGWPESDTINDWFSERLGRKVCLVRQATDQRRTVKRFDKNFVDFADSSQYLILGEASLQALNEKLSYPIPMDRFRPNIVFSGGAPHEEDNWAGIQIAKAMFTISKPCARCHLTNINQATADVGLEPIRTLAKYRLKDKKILFGQYLALQSGLGETLCIGDVIVASASRP